MSFHDATVPAFLQILNSLSGPLTKAEAHCKAKNIQPEVLLGARLFPNMYPLTRQIQTACDFAAKTSARLTGGGFGGCAVALVPAERAHSIAEHASAAYRAGTHREPRPFVVRAAAGAGIITD